MQESSHKNKGGEAPVSSCALTRVTIILPIGLGNLVWSLEIALIEKGLSKSILHQVKASLIQNKAEYIQEWLNINRGQLRHVLRTEAALL